MFEPAGRTSRRHERSFARSSCLLCTQENETCQLRMTFCNVFTKCHPNLEPFPWTSAKKKKKFHNRSGSVCPGNIQNRNQNWPKSWHLAERSTLFCRPEMFSSARWMQQLPNTQSENNPSLNALMVHHVWKKRDNKRATIRQPTAVAYSSEHHLIRTTQKTQKSTLVHHKPSVSCDASTYFPGTGWSSVA